MMAATRANEPHFVHEYRLDAAAIGLPLDFLKLMASTKTIGGVRAGTHTNLEEGEDGGGGKSIRSACKF